MAAKRSDFAAAAPTRPLASSVAPWYKRGRVPICPLSSCVGARRVRGTADNPPVRRKHEPAATTRQPREEWEMAQGFGGTVEDVLASARITPAPATLEEARTAP